jgi:hemerythrin
LLNDLSQCCEYQFVTADTVSQALERLNVYSQKHFMAEEALMCKLELDERHIRDHRMEHRSFMYDVERLSIYAESPDNLIEMTEKLVRFIAHWWTCHILGVDRAMTLQLFNVKKGMTAVEAYEVAQKVKQDHEGTQLMLDSVLELWRSATERCHALEKELALLKERSL